MLILGDLYLVKEWLRSWIWGSVEFFCPGLRLPCKIISSCFLCLFLRRLRFFCRFILRSWTRIVGFICDRMWRIRKIKIKLQRFRLRFLSAFTLQLFDDFLVIIRNLRWSKVSFCQFSRINEKQYQRIYFLFFQC